MLTPRLSPHVPTERVIISSVSDGDTYHGSWHHGDVTIRILGFDAPEIAQPGGGWAAAIVRRILTGRILITHVVASDRYGRSVMDLRWPDGGRVSLTLLESGLGWADLRYAPDSLAFSAAEASARSRRLGIWHLDNPEPPWSARGHRPSPWLKRRAHRHYRFRR